MEDNTPNWLLERRLATSEDLRSGLTKALSDQTLQLQFYKDIAHGRLKTLEQHHSKVQKILQKLVDAHNELARFIQEQ